MTQTYFDHPPEERYTWFSENKTTKKVIDYVLMERYIQQFVQDCSVKSQMDFGSPPTLIDRNAHTFNKKSKKVSEKTKAHTKT